MLEKWPGIDAVVDFAMQTSLIILSILSRGNTLLIKSLDLFNDFNYLQITLLTSHFSGFVVQVFLAFPNAVTLGRKYEPPDLV